jgi:hypothetical protein
MGEGRGRPDKLSNCRLIAKVRVSGVTGMELNNGADAALGGARRRGARKVPGSLMSVKSLKIQVQVR